MICGTFFYEVGGNAYFSDRKTGINIRTMMENDVRWEQRFLSYKKALSELQNAIDYIHHNVDDEDSLLDTGDIEHVVDKILITGLIKYFEMTYELAWNVMQDYARYIGNSEVAGPRPAIREAFQLQLFENGKIWMEMLKSRNLTSHTYNQETANEVYHRVVYEFFPALIVFRDTMEAKRSGEQSDLFE